MSTTSWAVRLRWAPWSRVVRLHLAGDRWPRLSEGPISVALRLAWLLLLVPVLLGCWLELLLVLVLLPFALIARAAGTGWRLEVSSRGCRAGVIRVGGLAAARRLRRVLREHLGTHPGLDDARALLAAEQAELQPVEISARRWRLVSHQLSPYGRRRWFLWRRRLSFEDAMDSLPSGFGDDPISAIIAIPFLLWFAVLFTGATLELLAEIAVLPLVFVLKLCHVLSWPVELVRQGSVEPQAQVRGMVASVRARRALTAGHALRLPLPSLVRRAPQPVS
ncbi:hypothetical protein AB0L88_23055 [Saccharopolyspora shandongensis]|uniref:hypothetical protein n=1 Tax=Saccharopolyspora shandongensis TaxID=418495 RepID=UPI00342E1DEB